MYESVKIILSVIGLIALVAGIENGLYWISDNVIKNHLFTYILHGVVLFLIVLAKLYP